MSQFEGHQAEGALSPWKEGQLLHSIHVFTGEVHPHGQGNPTCSVHLSYKNTPSRIQNNRV